MLAILDNNMVGALRIVSVERGHDPRDFTLVPFGGAGPLHGCALAELLGIRRVLVPPAPGVLCADGLLAADLKADFSPHPAADRQGRHRYGAPRSTPSCPGSRTTGSPRRRWRRPTASEVRVALMRYHGQGGEVPVGWVDDAAGVEAAFAAAHESLYGFKLDVADRAGDPAHRSDGPHARATAAASCAPAVDRSRKDATPFISPRERPRCRCSIAPLSAPVISWEGPAIITQLDATTLVAPGWSGRGSALRRDPSHAAFLGR